MIDESHGGPMGIFENNPIVVLPPVVFWVSSLLERQHVHVLILLEERFRSRSEAVDPDILKLIH